MVNNSIPPSNQNNLFYIYFKLSVIKCKGYKKLNLQNTWLFYNSKKTLTLAASVALNLTNRIYFKSSQKCSIGH